jgi:hypothetical protein
MPNGCDDLRGFLFAAGAPFDTRRDHAEDIAFNPVPYLTASHYTSVDIPASLETRPSNRLLGSSRDLGEIRTVVENHHIVDVRDLRHVYGVVDDGYVLARRHNVGTKPRSTQVPDRAKVVVFRTYAEAYVD